MDERGAPLWRLALSWLCLAIFCLALPVALVTGWVRLTVANPGAFGRTMASLAADGRVQEAVGRVVAARVASSVAGENPSATEALQSRVVGEVVREAMRDVVESVEFREIWESTTAAAHDRLIAVQAHWGEPITLDFTPLDDNIQAEIASLDLELPTGFAFNAENLRIQVFDPPTADRLRLAAQRVNAVLAGSAVLAAAALAASLAVAPDRLAALIRASFGLALAMLALMAAMVAAQGWVMGETGPEGGAAVAGVILDALSQGLRLTAVALAAAGLLVAGALAGLRALVGRPRRASASTGT